MQGTSADARAGPDTRAPIEAAVENRLCQRNWLNLHYNNMHTHSSPDQHPWTNNGESRDCCDKGGLLKLEEKQSVTHCELSRIEIEDLLLATNVRRTHPSYRQGSLRNSCCSCSTLAAILNPRPDSNVATDATLNLLKDSRVNCSSSISCFADMRSDLSHCRITTLSAKTNTSVRVFADEFPEANSECMDSEMPVVPMPPQNFKPVHG